MLRNIIWLLTVFIIVIITIPLCFVLKLISLFVPGGELPGIMQFLVYLVVPLLLRITGARFNVRGKENLPEGAALYVGNHQSALDAFVPILFLGRLKQVIIKNEVEKLPLVGWWLRFFGCVFLDRKSVKAQVHCMMEITNKLKAGKSVALFPEGTRSKGPEMGEFKAGAIRSAIKAGVPVVPFAVDGGHKCFEDNGNRLTPGDIELSILPPVETVGLDPADSKEFVNAVRTAIQEELDRIRAEKGPYNA